MPLETTTRQPGGADHRSPVQRDLDIKRAVEMQICGSTMAEIAAEIGISFQQVSFDIQAARQLWREATIADIGEQIAEQNAHLIYVRQQALQGWLRSLRETAKAADGRDGRPEFLEVALRAIEARGKLLGLDADRSYDVTEYLRAEALKHGLDPAVIIAEAKRYQLLLAGGDPDQPA